MSSIIGIFAALMPERWRPVGMVTSTHAFVSGTIEWVACCGLLLYRYIAFANARFHNLPVAVTLGAAERGGQSAVMGLGVWVLLEYLFHPLTVILMYFALEGLIRAVAAYITSQTVATLPLIAIAWVSARVSAWRMERSLGERVADIVEKPGPVGYSLLIASCRPKPGWNHLITISYENELYEVVKEEQRDPPYRFIYLLRKKPEHKVVRGLHHYDPEEVLNGRA